jgi:hypothetical protein
MGIVETGRLARSTEVGYFGTDEDKPNRREKMVNLLSQKAVLADVVVRQWTGRKLDRRITDEVNQQHHADADAGRYNKLLIAKEAFTEVYWITGVARVKHYLMTLPWSNSGWRILPTAMYAEFANTFRQYRSDFDAAANQFAKLYPDYVQAAKKRLGNMFNEDDYPAASKVRGMYAFDVSIHPCPDVEDFRVSLAKEQMADIRSNLKEELEAALSSAMQEPVRRVVAVVEKMALKLKGYKPKTEKSKAANTFRDSLVTNIQELLPLLSAFNLTNDKGLTALAKRLETELCSNDADVLREDEETRKQVAKAADEILKQANALMA